MSTNATLTDLDNSLGDVETAVNALPTLITTQKNDLVTLFKDLEAKFASYGVTPNFSTEVTRAKAIVANLNTIAETLSANTTEVTNEDTSVDAPKPVLSVTAVSLTSETPTAVNVGATIALDVVVEESPVGKVPTGVVAIGDANGNVVASITLDTTGAGKASIIPIEAGTFSYIAQYSGDAANAPSNSTPLSFTVSAVFTPAPTPAAPSATEANAANATSASDPAPASTPTFQAPASTTQS